MDPLTALSLAGNVIQFVEFGSRLLGTAEELYHSSQGSLATNDELEFLTTDLRTLVAKLRTSLPATNAQRDPDQKDGNPWDSLKSICDQSVSVADELVTKLETLKINDDEEYGQKQVKYRKLKSMKTAVKSLWREKEISNLTERLIKLREGLETRVLFSIRETIDAQSIRTSARFNDLDSATQRIISSLADQVNATKDINEEFRRGMNTLTTTIAHMLSRLDLENYHTHLHRDLTGESIRRRELREKLRKEDINPFTPDAEMFDVSNVRRREELRDKFRRAGPKNPVTPNIEMFNVPNIAEQNLRDSVCWEIVQSLSYSTMSCRYEDIVEAHPETFQWAFQDPTNEQLPWSNLSEWLKTGNELYWISGKAGSGKSTLMKFLHDSDRTREYLRTWAGATPLAIATFFFWNSGAKEQKSQIGLLRALLFQIFTQHMELVPECLPEDWARAYVMGTQNISASRQLKTSWSLRKLTDTLRAVIHQKTIPLKIFLFIDGLDEFDGDYEELARLFQESAQSTGTKVCLSSRPWIVFEDVFGKCSKLQLQNLTYTDVDKYVSDKLTRNDAFQRLAELEPKGALALIHEIVKKADGVFLWVKLVVQSLVTGIRNRDELLDLWQRIRCFPRELEALYDHLLGLVEPIYLTWVSNALQILQINQILGSCPFAQSSGKRPGVQPLSLAMFFLAMNDGADIETLQDPAKIDIKCDDTRVHLTARCAGFLEVSKPKNMTLFGPDCLVQYFHRTARDFLDTKFRRSELFMRTKTNEFDPNFAMMKACIRALQLKPLIAELEKGLGGKNRMYRSHIISIAMDTMIYAHHAEAHAGPQSSRTELLDQFHFSMDVYNKSWGAARNQWIKNTVAWNKEEYRRDIDFLKFAAALDLKSYVREKIHAIEGVRRVSEATALLRFLLPSEEYHICQWELPFPSTGMVSLLLASGADPNGRDACPFARRPLSSWESSFLYTARCAMSNVGVPLSAKSCIQRPHFESPGVSSDDHKEDYTENLAQRYLKIMKLLVESGADLHLRTLEAEELVETRVLKSMDNVDLDILSIADRVLLKNFPIDAAPLVHALREAFALSELTKGTEKRKRSRDEVQQNERKNRKARKRPNIASPPVR